MFVSFISISFLLRRWLQVLSLIWITVCKRRCEREGVYCRRWRWKKELSCWLIRIWKHQQTDKCSLLDLTELHSKCISINVLRLRAAHFTVDTCGAVRRLWSSAAKSGDCLREVTAHRCAGKVRAWQNTRWRSQKDTQKTNESTGAGYCPCIDGRQEHIWKVEINGNDRRKHWRPLWMQKTRDQSLQGKIIISHAHALSHEWWKMLSTLTAASMLLNTLHTMAQFSQSTGNTFSKLVQTPPHHHTPRLCNE